MRSAGDQRFIGDPSCLGGMSPTGATNPDCEIVQALTYARGNQPGENVPTTPCGEAPVKSVRIQGSPTHVSVIPGAHIQGPISTFALCQKHRRDPRIREAKLEPAPPR